MPLIKDSVPLPSLGSFRERLFHSAMGMWQTFWNGFRFSEYRLQPGQPAVPLLESASGDEENLESVRIGVETKQENVETQKPNNNCLKLTLWTAVIVGFICFFCYIGRDYIRYLLLWMEQAEPWMTFLIFAVLFTLVSFPMVWGYVLLNVAAGYLYGILYGTITVTVCALIGLFIAHLVIRKFLSEFVSSKLQGDSMQALIRVVESNKGFKIIVLARLTPFPFGLQNALFAISNFNTISYLGASILGLFPTQVLNAYIGSTLRSMEEVISDSSNTPTAYIVFILQLILTVGLMIYVARKAKTEFNKALESPEGPSSVDEELKLKETVSCVHNGGFNQSRGDSSNKIQIVSQPQQL